MSLLYLQKYNYKKTYFDINKQTQTQISIKAVRLYTYKHTPFHNSPKSHKMLVITSNYRLSCHIHRLKSPNFLLTQQAEFKRHGSSKFHIQFIYFLHFNLFIFYFYLSSLYFVYLQEIGYSKLKAYPHLVSIVHLMMQVILVCIF